MILEFEEVPSYCISEKVGEAEFVVAYVFPDGQVVIPYQQQ